MVAIIFLVVIFFSLWIYASQQVNQLKNELQEKTRTHRRELENLREQVNTANRRISELAKYQAIVDAEDHAKNIMIQANREAQVAREMGQNELRENRRIGQEITKEANALKRSIKENYDSVIRSASITAEKLIAEARKKLVEKYGDNFYTIERATELKGIAIALENKISGYGDKYLKSVYSVLDDLAVDYAHSEAGQKLKAARDVTRIKIENGTAANCDYVEESRKTTAVNFVLDAFNGKVEVILSKVKKDNYGTLAQQIKDAYYLVNNLGRAFRNTAISEQYLEGRLEELKWAAVVQELKWQEQDEQRRIKEQIREEEKARREYERAIREAEKEEETLKRLIEKAQKEVAKAGDEQRSKYEDRLRELEDKLHQAEEKSKRALSMAQQTKSGNVYIISNIGSFGDDVYKIGMTRRLEPLDRIRELGDASVPFEFDVHALIYAEDAPKLERELHKKFVRMQMNKVNPRKEFFRVGVEQIKQEVEKMGIEANWTLAAVARQYKDTLALEEQFRHNEQSEKDWERAQAQREERESQLVEEQDEALV